MKQNVTMEKLVALARQRGFIFPGSEIYGGLANSWDYGPLGVELKNNVKKLWWKKFVQESPYNVGMDTAILMNPSVWEASGHVGGFSDPLIDCKSCHSRYRADQLIENWAKENDKVIQTEGLSNADLLMCISENKIECPSCKSHEYTDIRKFNLMFKTFQGVTEDSSTEIFLRPETAQGIFVNFRNVQRSTRKKLPFGICQIGKSFRNEITPGNFTFRTREFEQMEMEFFCTAEESKSWFEYWRSFCYNWLISLNMKPEELRLRDHDPKELAFYSDATTDFEFLFPFGWGELWGIANRTTYDLNQHMTHSKKDLSYTDPHTNEKFVPYVIEPSLGVDRVTLAFLSSAYEEEELENGDSRTVLRFHKALAPIKIAILPLSAKLTDQTTEIFSILAKHWMVELDDRQSIGKRYRRQDEIGTPYCVTFDFDSLEDHCVTIRDRDTMEQVRIHKDELVSWFKDKFDF